jgi:hypothetical protein
MYHFSFILIMRVGVGIGRLGLVADAIIRARGGVSDSMEATNRIFTMMYAV